MIRISDDYICDLSACFSGVCVLFLLVPLQNLDLVLQVGVVQLFLLHTLQGVEIPGLSLCHQVDLRKRAPAETHEC